MPTLRIITFPLVVQPHTITNHYGRGTLVINKYLDSKVDQIDIIQFKFHSPVAQ